MICEYCKNENLGKYGSGRFCDVKCARAFSTFSKREEINVIVSAKLKGKKTHGKGFKKGFDHRRKKFTIEERKKGVLIRLENQRILYENLNWIDLPHAEKRRRLILEQKSKCGECGLSNWRGKPITLDLHHIDGDHNNENKNNLIFLCPNCHSQTPNYKNKGSKADKKLMAKYANRQSGLI